MTDAYIEFTNCIKLVRSLKAIYEYLVNSIRLSRLDVSDILRVQLVNTVSAMDRYLHEIIRIGIGEIFQGKRIATNKFKSLSLSSSTVLKIKTLIESPSATPLSPEDDYNYWINREIVEKLSFYAFQHPDKIKDGLAYIWNEEQKWQVVAKDMGITGLNDNEKRNKLQEQLILISERRNQIVHEADIDPVINLRRDIVQSDIDDLISFIEQFVTSVHKIVTSADCYNVRTA